MKTYRDGIAPFWIIVSLVLSLTGTAAPGANVGASLKGGTPGVGADVTVGLVDRLNVRAGVSGFSMTFKPDDEEIEDENITARIHLLTIPLLLDWHPFATHFRLSGGFMVNNNKASLTAEPGDSIEFNDVDYRVESFSMNVSFNTFSPYLGIGYGNAAKAGRRWVFAFDLGIMYHGVPEISARAIAADPAQQARLDRDLDIEIADLRDDVRPFSFYPVLSLGLSYRF